MIALSFDQLIPYLFPTHRAQTFSVKLVYCVYTVSGTFQVHHSYLESFMRRFHYTIAEKQLPQQYILSSPDGKICARDLQCWSEHY